MHTSIVRVLAVTLIAAGSFTASVARPSHHESAASAAPKGNNPGIPIPICPGCGHGNND